MINKAKSYAINISNKLFQHSTESQILLSDILIFTYLIALCQAQVSVLNNKRRVPLLCDNSIKTNKSSKLCKIFQSYAKNHNYQKIFPSHREEAIDVYTKQLQNNMEQLLFIINSRQKPNQIKTMKISNQQFRSKEDYYHPQKVLNMMRNIANNGIQRNNIIIHQDTWNMILTTVKRMEVICQLNQQKINELKAITKELEAMSHKTSFVTSIDTSSSSISTETEKLSAFYDRNYSYPSYDDDIFDDFNNEYNQYNEYENDFNMEYNVI